MELTHDIYGQRKLDLTRAIELAEGEFHSAAFKQQTGAGSASQAGNLIYSSAHRNSVRLRNPGVSVATKTSQTII
jgi:hypothetical protein